MEREKKNSHYSDQEGHAQRTIANKLLAKLEVKNPHLAQAVVLLTPNNPTTLHTSRRSMRRTHISGKRTRKS